MADHEKVGRRDWGPWQPLHTVLSVPAVKRQGACTQHRAAP